MKKNKIEERLREQLSPDRFRHTIGVAYTAAALAMAHGSSQEQAYTAGLLHDCAKAYSIDEQKELCAIHRIPLSSFQKQSPQLIHAVLGAHIARSQFDLTDEQSLSAIVCHTTGKPGMTLLEKIIFIADYIEPGRKEITGISQARHAAFHDLDQCLIMILGQTIAFLKEKNAVIDPVTKKTYEYYCKEEL